jgi:nitrite reductase/ring-hydroxylating ferredoxin subunit
MKEIYRYRKSSSEILEGKFVHMTSYDLTCLWYGATWDVTTGNFLMFPAKLKHENSFKLSLENETVYAEVR